MFAGANEVIGEAFSAFVEVDFDFVEVGESFEFLIGFFVEGVWAVCDSMLVDDRYGEVEIVPKTIGVISEWVDMLGAVIVS